MTKITDQQGAALSSSSVPNAVFEAQMAAMAARDAANQAAGQIAAQRDYRQAEVLSRRMGIACDVFGLMRAGWSVEDALAAGEKVAQFVEAANGNAG